MYEVVLEEDGCTSQLGKHGIRMRHRPHMLLGLSVDRASGDLIPWTLSQQFQDSDFATLSGARIVRVATHPDVQSMGYGTRALKLLLEYFAKPKTVRLADESENEEDAEESEEESEPTVNGKKSTLREEIIGPRKKIPPLLRRLHERTGERLDYMGVFVRTYPGPLQVLEPAWLCALVYELTPNELTGEHTCIMVTTNVCRANTDNAKWLSDFHTDFRRRFVHLLAYEFRKLAPGLALSILEPGSNFSGSAEEKDAEKSLAQIKEIFSPYDFRRLESYAKNLVDYHVVVDMLPKLAEMYTLRGFGSKEDLHLSHAQSAILMGLGLQHKSVDDLAKSLDIQSSQVLALFNKVVRKISTCIRKMEEKSLAAKIGPEDAEAAAQAALPNDGVEKTLDEDLEDGIEKEMGKSEKD